MVAGRRRRYTASMATTYRKALILLISAALAGCHGGGGGSSMVPGVTAQSSGSLGGGTASFRIVVPAPVRPGAPNGMQSVVVSLATVNGAAPATKTLPVTLNLTATTPGCTPSGGGALTCLATISVPSGRDNFTVVTYAKPNGTGAQVSSTQASAVITAGSKTACVPTGPGNAPAPADIPKH